MSQAVTDHGAGFGSRHACATHNWNTTYGLTRCPAPASLSNDQLLGETGRVSTIVHLDARPCSRAQVNWEISNKQVRFNGDSTFSSFRSSRKQDGE